MEFDAANRESISNHLSSSLARMSSTLDLDEHGSGVWVYRLQQD
jgi:hypothetical protein